MELWNYFKIGLKILVLGFVVGIVSSIIQWLLRMIGVLPTISGLTPELIETGFANMPNPYAMVLPILIIISITILLSGFLAQWFWNWDDDKLFIIPGLKLYVVNIVSFLILIVPMIIVFFIIGSTIIGAAMIGNMALLGGSAIIALIVFILSLLISITISGYLAQKFWGFE